MNERLKLYSLTQLSDLFTAGNKVFGMSKSYPPASKQMPLIDKLRGDAGEQIISGILNLNAIETEDMFVCHSVGTHDDSNGETDHIVIYRNQIIVIETKAFAGYTSVRINDKGVAVGARGDAEFRVSDNKLDDKVKLYQKRFPARHVSGLLVLARSNVETKTMRTNYDAASLSNLQDKLDKIVASASDIDEGPWVAVKFFASLCIKRR